jgi:thiol:disulfide interchange protein
LTFTCIGLGMATPYLLIGAFPKLISFLPKPGLWMDTFKQLMGFLMLGTVVFLFSSLDQKWVIPTLTLLLGIGIGCWWLGRTPMTEEFSRRMIAWASSLVIIAVAAVVGFVVFVPRHQLDWVPFARAVLEEHRKEGRTVLVDFTAHW